MVVAHGDGPWCAPESVVCTPDLGKPMVVSVFDLRWQGRELGCLEINGPSFSQRRFCTESLQRASTWVAPLVVVGQALAVCSHCFSPPPSLSRLLSSAAPLGKALVRAGG